MTPRARRPADRSGGTGSPEFLDVTVVIPTRNRLTYLQETLATVWAQLPPVSRVIVVDDDSSDGTAAWLAQAGTERPPAGRPRWQVLRQSPAKERANARNAGLSHCDTEFVIFLDDDDLLRRRALSILASALAERPTAAGAAGAYRRFGALSEAARDRHPCFRRITPVWREELFGWNMPPSSLLWRTDVIRAMGGWDPSVLRCEDRDLNLRAYPRQFVLVPETVMDYRVHPRASMTTAQLDVDHAVRARFVASLRDRDRQVGETILDVHRHFEQGLARYIAGDFRAALSAFVTVGRRAPVLYLSPVLGSWLAGLLAKAAIGALLPRRTGAAVQAAVRRRRPPAPVSPEQDTMA